MGVVTKAIILLAPIRPFASQHLGFGFSCVVRDGKLPSEVEFDETTRLLRQNPGFKSLC
jgi:hypothetical protein